MSQPASTRPSRHRFDALLFAVDLAGTFVFGIEGAIAAVAANLDALGLMVLAFSTALGGGIIRDLLIGAAPPRAIRDWRYGATAFAAGAVVFFLYQFVQQVPDYLLITLDAAGLSLFAISGATKALAYDVPPFIAVLLGTITGVGGGTLRDLMLAHVPNVLRSDIYAVAAMLGSAVMVVGLKLKLSPTMMSVIGGVVCFALRMVSVWQHWNLPRVSTH